MAPMVAYICLWSVMCEMQSYVKRIVVVVSRWCWVTDNGAMLFGYTIADFNGGAVLLGNVITSFHDDGVLLGNIIIGK